jgi:hypothetical protein
MAKEVLVEEGRVMKAVGNQGEMERIELLRPIVTDSGEIEYENDLSQAKFDVIVEVGPSSSTKRAATVRALTNMARVTQDPETLNVLSAMAIMNMEGEGIGDVRAYFRKKLLRMGVVQPTEQEAKELAEEQANAKPSAQDEYLQAAAVKEKSEAIKNQADTIYTQARADKARAETAETLVDIGDKKQERAIKTIETLGPRVTPQDVPGSDVQE